MSSPDADLARALAEILTKHIQAKPGMERELQNKIASFSRHIVHAMQAARRVGLDMSDPDVLLALFGEQPPPTLQEFQEKMLRLINKGRN